MNGFNRYCIIGTRLTKDGDWTKTEQLPTFWVLGGCEDDAIKNAKTLLGEKGNVTYRLFASQE